MIATHGYQSVNNPIQNEPCIHPMVAIAAGIFFLGTSVCCACLAERERSVSSGKYVAYVSASVVSGIGAMALLISIYRDLPCNPLRRRAITAL